MPAELWTTIEPSKFFLIPEGRDLPAGSLEIRSLRGNCRTVDAVSTIPYEITEDQARRWATDQLGQTLDELKDGLDDALAEMRQRLEEHKRTPVSPNTTITPNATTAILDLLKNFPRVVARSLSSDAARVDEARATMAALQEQLRAAGIDVDDRFGTFPERLAGLRRDAGKASADDPGEKNRQG